MRNNTKPAAIHETSVKGLSLTYPEITLGIFVMNVALKGLFLTTSDILAR